MSLHAVTFFYDLGSPFAYLTADRIDEQFLHFAESGRPAGAASAATAAVAAAVAWPSSGGIGAIYATCLPGANGISEATPCHNPNQALEPIGHQRPGNCSIGQRACTVMLKLSLCPACKRWQPAKAIIAPLSVQNSGRA